MQVSMEKVSNIERRMTIVVPANQVEQAYVKQMSQFVKKANIKGFRPGKVPKNYIEQRFGDKVRQDALSEVMKHAFYEAITQENVKPISSPHIEPKMMLANRSLEFTASFEVLPDIEKIQFYMERIEKLMVSVHPEDIHYVMKQLCKQHTKWRIVERAAQEKDRVVVDYHPIFEGQAEMNHKKQNFPVELSNHVMLPGFEEGLVGALPGEERTLRLNFPADFSIAERAGKPIEFVVKVKQVFEADVPDFDETFIQRLGVSSGKIKDLEAQIQQSLEQECDRMVKVKLKEQIFQHLLEQNPIEVPNALIAREANNIHNEIYGRDHQHDHSEKEMATLNNIAKKRVALSLLMVELTKQENLTVDSNRLQARIQEIASSYEKPEEVIEWLSSNPDKRANIEAQIMEEQLIDKLIANVSVIEKIVSYAELKGIHYNDN
jgi:trigger factor